MALDYQQVREQVKKLGENAPDRERQINETRGKARSLLASQAHEVERLRVKVERAASLNSLLRCAMPVQENLDASFPLPALPEAVTILAADGSQINPNRHAAVNYCLVNVGAVEMRHGSPEAPQLTIQTQLFYDDAMYTPSGVITEGMVALIRDERERTVLAELAEKAPKPVVSLTDGPIELWGEREASRKYKEHFEKYIQALSLLHKNGAATAGYVDKPRADLVVRLLEVAQLDDGDLGQAGRKRDFLGVTDIDLYWALLAPGERSAVFAIQSRSAEKYKDELSLHFFYLNVGRENSPWLVRIETPAWVVEDGGMLDTLHAVLIDQCHKTSAEPFPYVLHRAHETAVVTRDEKEHLEQMIAQELLQRGVSLGRTSPKQGLKDSKGRARY